MRINELFTGQKQWEWNFQGSEEVAADFEVGNVVYRFYAYSNPEDPSTWEVEFSAAGSGRRGSKFGITGSGNAAQVFGTVVSILKEFLFRRPDITTLRFTAEEPSRQALYKRMIARLLPGWSLQISHDKDFTVTKGNAQMRINETAGPKVSFNTTKSSNAISVEMNVDGQYAGTFQYNAGNGRSLVELDPDFQGKGLGKILILKGIYIAIRSGLDYVEDESRTQAFDNAMDSLADAGYIVNDDEYWYVTSEGEQYLDNLVQ